MGDAWVSDINFAHPMYGATVSVSTEVTPKLIGNNLLERPTYLAWRSQNTSDTFTIDLGQNRSLDTFCMITRRYTDPALRFETPFFSSSDTYRLYFDADGGTAGTGAVHDTGNRNFGIKLNYGYEPYLLEWDSLLAQNIRYIHGVINAPSKASLGYFDLSYFWAGLKFRPSINFLLNDDDMSDDLSSKEEAPVSGVLFTDVAEKLREWQFIFNRLTAAERRQVRDSQHWLGHSGVMLVGRTSDETYIHDEVMLCSFKQITGITNNTVETSSKRYRLRETR